MCCPKHKGMVLELGLKIVQGEVVEILKENKANNAI